MVNTTKPKRRSAFTPQPVRRLICFAPPDLDCFLRLRFVVFEFQLGGFAPQKRPQKPPEKICKNEPKANPKKPMKWAFSFT
jgi:hypothetical protein